MSVPQRIYLDNAATSWPKPESVYEAVDAYQRQFGAAAGRGTYADGQHASQQVKRTRTLLVSYLNAPADGNVVFTCNGTDALNLCVLGTLRDGDRVVTSVVEHNSVLRPLTFLRQTRNISVDFIDCDQDGVVLVDALEQSLKLPTRMVILSHASNVTGAIQPIAAVGRLARAAGALMLVDAAQSVGHLPIDLGSLPVDMLAASGHKGLLGPLGTGIAYLAPGIAEQTTPLRFGGTGTNSESEEPPSHGCERFEAGNLNVPAIAGLAAGVEFLQNSPQRIQQMMRQATFVREELSHCQGVTVFSPPDAKKSIGLASFVIDRYDCHEVAALLEASFGIQVRAGLHCAPRMHRQLGVAGTVRASWGPFTTDEELTTFTAAIANLTTT